jgi:iron complex outermembrane recepter protein
MNPSFTRPVGALVLAFYVSLFSASVKAQAPSTDNTNALANQIADESSNQASSPDNGELQQMTVTGYAIPRVGDGPINVEHLDDTFLQRTGSVNLQDALQHLPNNMNHYTRASNMGSSFIVGESTPNLFALGPTATLVLMDGLRLPYSPALQDGTNTFVDVNNIPTSAIESTEVLYDGATALYGSDAVAGVVNIRLKDDFSGGDIGFDYRVGQNGAGAQYRVHAVGGITEHLNDHSKFNVMAALEYFEQDPIKTTAFAFAREQDLSGYGFDNNLSAQPGIGEFYYIANNKRHLLHTATGSNGDLGQYPLQPDGKKQQVFNTSGYSNLLSRDSILNFIGRASYDPNQYIHIHGTVLFTETHDTQVSYRYRGASSVDNIIVPSNNPYNTTGHNLNVQSLSFLNSNNDQALSNATRIQTYWLNGGIRFQNLPNNWFISLDAVYSESQMTSQTAGFLSKSKLNLALAGQLPGFEGQFFNPFTDFYAHSPKNDPLFKALQINPLRQARSQMDELLLQAGGDLFELPSGPVTLGLGIQYTDNKLVQFQDTYTEHRDVASLSGGGTSASRSIVSGYYQVSIPILGNKWSFPGGRDLELIMGQRYDEYSDFGSASKPGFSILYKPLDDLAIRANYQESFIAPSLYQLHAANATAYKPGLVDYRFPRGNPFRNPYPIIYRDSNSDLKPETAYSYSLGFVWTPGSKDPEHSLVGFLNGLNVYATIYHYKVSAIPDTFPIQSIINSPDMQDFVTRDASGKIVAVKTKYLNIGEESVSGIYYGLNYSTKEFNWGKLTFNFNGTWQYEVSQQTTPGDPFLDYTNSGLGNGGSPGYSFITDLIYSKTLNQIDGFETGLTLNYWSWFKNAEFDPEHPSAPYHKSPSWQTFDWRISYTFGKPDEIKPEAPRPGYGKDGKRMVGDSYTTIEAAKPSWCRLWLAGSQFTFGIYNLFDRHPYMINDVFGFDSLNVPDYEWQRTFYVQFRKKF